MQELLQPKVSNEVIDDMQVILCPPTCIDQREAFTWEGGWVAGQRLMQQLILVFLSQLTVQPQHSYLPILNLQGDSDACIGTPLQPSRNSHQ